MTSSVGLRLEASDYLGPWVRAIKKMFHDGIEPPTPG